MWKGQASSPDSTSLNQTAKGMATKDKKQTTAKVVRVLWKDGRSSKLHNNGDQKEGKSSQFFANQEPEIKYLEQLCTMPDTYLQKTEGNSPLNSMFCGQTYSMPSG